MVKPEKTILSNMRKSTEIVESEGTMLPLPEENSNSVSTEPETLKEEEYYDEDLIETTS